MCEPIGDAISIISAGAEIASGMLQRKNFMRERADDYLVDCLIKNGEITEYNLDVAVKLFGITELVKKCENKAKIVSKADKMCLDYYNQKKKQPEDIDDDWMLYFLDRASLVSDETIQTLWASIFTKECFEKGSFRKVMLDRIAMLDRSTADAFGKLCALTYGIKVSDDRDYSIPLYLRDASLKRIINSNNGYSESDALKYQNIRHNEEELEILQDIGLIKLSSEFDDGDIYSSEKIDFTITTSNSSFDIEAIYDDENDVFYQLTGNASYTRIGLELYEAVKRQYPQQEILDLTVKSFYDSAL